MDPAIIERYASQADTPARAIAGLEAADLQAHPIPGTWTIQQIVVHLLESDLAATHRMRRIVAEDKPLLIAYDESALARELNYDRADLGIVCELFALNRKFTAAWLRQTDAAAFARAGVHNQRGLVTLADLVRMYVEHVDAHLVHLREKRRLLGKPLNW